MAVDNPPHPAPAANPRLAVAKDVVLIISGLGGFSAVLIAAIALVFSMTIAPLRDDLRLMRQEMNHGFEAVDAEFKTVREEMQHGFEAVDAEFKTVREEMQHGFEAVGFKTVREEMQRGFEAVDADFKAMDAQFKAIDDEFKAVRQDLAALSERLVRLETLLEQGAGQGQAPAAPDTQTE